MSEQPHWPEFGTRASKYPKQRSGFSLGAEMSPEWMQWEQLTVRSARQWADQTSVYLPLTLEINKHCLKCTLYKPWLMDGCQGQDQKNVSSHSLGQLSAVFLRWPKSWFCPEAAPLLPSCTRAPEGLKLLQLPPNPLLPPSRSPAL